MRVTRANWDKYHPKVSIIVGLLRSLVSDFLCQKERIQMFNGETLKNPINHAFFPFYCSNLHETQETEIEKAVSSLMLKFLLEDKGGELFKRCQALIKVFSS
jgi:hypothetical protein